MNNLFLKYKSIFYLFEVCPPLAYVEIPKFDENANIKKELKNWILFLKSNKEEDMSQLLKEDTIFEKALKNIIISPTTKIY